ncbi:hypothetical protein C8255_00820 [filamentous cyanobacterium CCP3]|nr:hypothetical protein C8255_00820 [filamentous cyanobacterium CCP3]
MEYWEFLLQKEGDQSWLPLDAAQVEILEGRYRVMAHTSQTNTPVRIQISQLLPGGQELRSPLQGEAAKRRTLRRQGETNSNGLMVVMPFTRLREGSWDIQCASASSPDEAAPTQPTWCYAVQLRVVAQNSADDDDWFADDGSAGLGAIAAGLQTDPVAPSSAPDIDLEAAAAAMDAFQAQLAAGLDERTYGLTLPHTALLGSEGESLGLTSTVTGPAPGDSPGRPPLTLVVRLSDPQTAVAVALAPVPLAVAALPSTVTLTVAVPPRLSTRLLLGEVGLLAGAEVVALHQFTVTVDVASLFDAIANQAETDTDLDVVFSSEPADAAESVATSPPSNPDLKTWDIASRAAPPREMPILTLPRGGTALPPKIYYPSPYETAAHQPTLPPVGRPKASHPATPVPAPEAAPEAGTPVRETAAGSNPSRGLSLPPVSPPSQAADPLAALSGQPPAPSSKPRRPAPQLISHEDMGFKDLKLQDRFWSRLNELAVNLQQAALDQRSQETLEAEPAVAEDVDDALPKFIPFAGEVVIYEDEDPALRTLTPDQAVAPKEPEAGAAETITPPMPILVLPEGDLTAGEPVLVTIRVPFHPNRLYLKVWITDPQTRSLADEPRQVMNLLPNGQGQLEGNLQLTVPLGCLEARFEAISIDLVTQQESYKASVSRDIILPGLTSSGLDEFQL